MYALDLRSSTLSSETTECEERACSDLQENKPAPTNESDKIIDCEALHSILDSTPLTTLQTKNLKRQPKIFSVEGGISADISVSGEKKFR